MSITRLFSAKKTLPPDMYSNKEVKILVNGNGTEFDKYLTNKIYDSKKYLESVLNKIKDQHHPIKDSSFTSMISRCIENNSNRQILIDLLDFCKCNHIAGPLYLRRVSNVDYLSLAATYGFHDLELTKRIVLMQKLIKGQEKPTLTYESRQPGDDDGYFGYRHAMYFIRYNPTQRLKLFEHCDWGGCNWQAYADYVGDEMAVEVCEEIKKRF